MLKRSLVLVALLLFNLPAHALHVILDPGHGGNDRGATTSGGAAAEAHGLINEADITLKVAQLVAERLRANDDFQVTLTRNSDLFVSLEDRASLANTKGDLFLSIHVNSSADPRARGKEVYFQNQLPADEETLFLASRENGNLKSPREVVRTVSLNVKSRPHLNPDVRAIVEDLERHNRLQESAALAEKLHLAWQGDTFHRRQAIRQAPFFVVSNIDKPAALIEIGYLSNPKEAAKLVNPEYQRKIADGIYTALIRFKENVDKPAAKSLN